jgi:hypothetical protein
MSSAICNVPVVLLVFNRPDHTRQVLQQVRRAKPPVLLVVADGPRPQVPQDAAACDDARALIEEMVDWGPTLLKNYAPANLGLRRRVGSGLTWAFEQVERAIILEDDCVPDPSFFRFCSELLTYYETDTRIGVITGDNFQPPTFSCRASYYFSKFNHCWGWATWRRAWRLFSSDMEHWPELRDAGWLEGLFPDPGQVRYWQQLFDRVYEGQLNSWAYRWTFSCWSQSLLTAIPRKNLVSNIGFGTGATHTTSAPSPLANRPATSLDFPLVHPPCVALDARADAYTQTHLFGSVQPGPKSAPASDSAELQTSATEGSSAPSFFGRFSFSRQARIARQAGERPSRWRRIAGKSNAASIL